LIKINFLFIGMIEQVICAQSSVLLFCWNSRKNITMIMIWFDCFVVLRCLSELLYQLLLDIFTEWEGEKKRKKERKKERLKKNIYKSWFPWSKTYKIDIWGEEMKLIILYQNTSFIFLHFIIISYFIFLFLHSNLSSSSHVRFQVQNQRELVGPYWGREFETAWKDIDKEIISYNSNHNKQV